MPAKAKIGDYVNMNCPHGGIGVIVSGSGTEGDDNEHTARLGDKVVCMTCGMSGRIINGSPNVYVDGKSAARKADSTTGTCDIGMKCCPHSRSGTIRSGSSKTFLNDT